MDLIEVSRREKRQTFLAAIAFALVAAILVPPVVEAAVTRVRGTVTAKVKDSTGDPVESEAIGPMGLLQAEGTTGAIAVRNYAGGGGFIGAGDCSDATPLPATVEVTDSIVTGILMTGSDATVVASSESVDALFQVPAGQDFPLLNFRVSAENPNEFVGLGNGLTVTAPLKFRCTGADGQVVVLGQ